MAEALRTALASQPKRPPSALAQRGQEQLMERFLAERVRVPAAPGRDTRRQQLLYTAAFWARADAIETLLADGADPNVCNEGSGWTPLHAAAFQESGPAVMALLEAGANPNLPDANGLTPADFASASDSVWPQFAAEGCKRRTKAELVDMGVLACVAPAGRNSASASRPVSVYQKQRPVHAGPVDGDILAGEGPPQPRSATNIPGFRLW